MGGPGSKKATEADWKAMRRAAGDLLANNGRDRWLLSPQGVKVAERMIALSELAVVSARVADDGDV